VSLTREQAVTTAEQAQTIEVDSGPPRDLTMSRRGMIASMNQLASAVGLDVLRHGGNAVDAAIAAAAVLTVVEPRNGHQGGDTFMLFGLPDGRVIALNGSGAAPAAATLDLYRTMGGIPEDGLRSATAPGTVDCWVHAARTFGSRSLSELLAPAIEYADQGVAVTARLHRLLTLDAPTYAKFPASARVFIPDGRVPQVGDTFHQPGLAESLRRIARGGPREFYEGKLAAEMIAASEQEDGLFTAADFARHHTDQLEPISTDYRGYTVYEQPPVSQGIIVLLALKILEQFDLQSYGPGSAETIHLQIESLKLAFADRVRYLGDPAFSDIPLDWLLSDDHAREQAARIDPDRAAPTPLPPMRQPDTTYLCTADAQGMMVSYIHSLYSGSGVVLGDTGVVMNSRLLGFNLDEDSPNCLAPGKRPVHTLNPYLVQRDGETILVGGTPGANWQVQTNLQMLTNLFDFDMDVQQAIEAPRFLIGDQLNLDNPTVKVESRLDPAAIAALRAKGHAIDVTGPWDAGGAVQLIARDPKTDLYRGATEPRRPWNTVLGW
jgi:gamma-glutamyltranspeptidase/glutathione hydrolase